MSVLATAARTAAEQRRLGLLLVTLSAVAWSTAGFFTRLIPLDAWTILFWRGLFGAATGFVFVLAQERGGRVGGFWRGFVAMGWPGAVCTFLSALGMAAFLGALKLTTVAHVAIIYATVPFAAAALGWLVLRERAPPATLLASAIALLGVGVTVWGGAGEGGLAGDALALAMTLLMAAIIVVRRANPAVPLVPAACLSALASTFISLPFAAPLAADGRDLVALALFGISNMGVGLILFVIGARFIPAAQTALIGALDTPLAPLWVWLAFGETPGAAAILGGIVVFAAVIGHILVEQLRRGRG